MKSKDKLKEFRKKKEKNSAEGLQRRLVGAARHGSPFSFKSCIALGAAPPPEPSMSSFRAYASSVCLTRLAAQAGSLECLGLALDLLPAERQKERLLFAVSIAAWRQGEEALESFLRQRAPALGLGAKEGGEWIERSMDRGARSAVIALSAWLGPEALINPARGDTVLLAAARRGDGFWVEHFLERGADPTARDAQGNTALMLALSRAIESSSGAGGWLARRGMGPGERAALALAERGVEPSDRNHEGLSVMELIERFCLAGGGRGNLGEILMANIESKAIAAEIALEPSRGRAMARPRI